jgi:hypothetical protein
VNGFSQGQRELPFLLAKNKKARVETQACKKLQVMDIKNASLYPSIV